ncbi:MAG: FMN-binding glutamate synthase family protein [Candidatus Brocadiales bacterium]|nr:FMN-binding glutamate synthase family protein [Candidatus Bathyanammoxibius amoris]
MAISLPNRAIATGTRNRTPNDVTPTSGMCTICLDGCPGYCEIGKSSFRGPEVIYPMPFGKMTTAAQKEYPVDFHHFNITGTIAGPADPRFEKFTNVNLETRLGRDKGLKMKLPFVVTGVGSTKIAAEHFEGIGSGPGMCGTGVVIGENVCAMDSTTEFDSNEKVTHCPELQRRIDIFKRWQRDGYGFFCVQANDEDIRLGVFEYAMSKLGADAVELKWGQGAKSIGGEVKITNLKKARLLKKRGYVVIPDPEDPIAIESFQQGAFEGFERHTRIGTISEDIDKSIETFIKTVEDLRNKGAKYVFLKTGAYRPADLARALRFCSEAEIDVLTVDGAGGGTGMSPWRMMNEWGVPTVYLASLLHEYCDRLTKKNKYVPDVILAGGITMEDQIYKAFALCSPYIKAVGMSRSTICAAMVGKTQGELIGTGKQPKNSEPYGKSVEEVFYYHHSVQKEFGGNGDQIPASGLGVYSYYQRLATGLRQLMAGSRRLSLENITRDDIFALTMEAADVSGIPFVMDYDKEAATRILGA